jgi:HupE / UreJ protein
MTFRRVAAVLVLMFVWSARPAAHDIPVDVLVNMYVKPEGARLRVLIRVPLGAMRDMNLPLHGAGFLNLPAPDVPLREAAKLWLAQPLEIYEGDRRLPMPEVVGFRISLPSDKSFGTYDDALRHLSAAPLPSDTELIWNQSLFDVLLETPIASDQAKFSIKPELARLGVRTVTVMHFLPPGGTERAFEYTGDPGLIRLDPRWYQAAGRFVVLGFEHILDGIDHLLFLFCLVIPFRKLRQLVWIVTSFTVAHSVTLIGSAFGMAPGGLWFPPLIEVLIAASILYMALENIVGVTDVRRRWMITFGFGLVHGFGFSFALRETLQFAGSHLLTSLFAFNVGIELGQLLVLIALIPALQFLFRRVVAERMGTIILSAIVAHTAWHWMTERWATLRQFSWPVLDAATLARGLRWLMAIVILGAGIWVMRGLIRQRRGRPDSRVAESKHADSRIADS